MTTYNAPVEDMMFLFDNLKDNKNYKEIDKFKEISSDLVKDVLDQAAKINQEIVHPLAKIGDDNPCVYENGIVRSPPGYKEAYKKFITDGWTSLSCDPKYGGQGMPKTVSTFFEEMLSSASLSFKLYSELSIGAYNCILHHADNKIKDKFLPKIVEGKWSGTMCLTESQCGTDLGLIKTKAIKNTDGSFSLTGQKIFITSGDHDLTENIIHLVLAKIPGAPAGTKGISLIVVDLNSDGINRTKIDKLGWHASDTAEISFDNVKVPKENLIGEEGKGFYYLMNGLQLERLIFVPSCIGAMELAISESIKYMKERKSFGQTIDKFQVLRHKIATLSSQIESVKVFGYYCCDLYNKKIYDVKLCSMAKLLVTELHEKVATECLQFFGGNGFSEEYPLARMYRDCRVGTIGAGTSEIMREIIAKVILEETKYKETKS